MGLDLAAHGIAARELPTQMDVFIVFSLFRRASIVAGVYRRALDGNASDARALERGAAFRPVAEQAWALAQRCAVPTTYFE